MIEKIFKAYDVRATYPNPLNEDAAWKVGHATAQFLKRSRQQNPEPKVKLPDTIVVGRDMRPHSPALAAALCDGIRSVGMNVIDIGMIDTSFIYFAINHLDAVGGIQTTASHNPIQYNGFKISAPRRSRSGHRRGWRTSSASPARSPSAGTRACRASTSSATCGRNTRSACSASLILSGR